MAGPQANEQIDRVMGLRVYDVASRKLGTVEDVLIDETTGEIDCVTVCDDGVFGFRRHRFQVAWPMLTYSETRHALIFAPGVHREHEEHTPPPQDAARDAAHL